MAAAATAGLALPAVTGARGRFTIVLDHHRFVPVTGDWDGSTGGFAVSFELTYAPFLAGFPGHVPYQFEDLALSLPQSCPANVDEGHYVEVIGNNFLSPLATGGSLGQSRYGITGGVTGARSGKLTMHLKFLGATRCQDTLVWTIHPAHRHPVPGGHWRVRFGDGQTGSFTVTAGGRLTEGPALPSGFACNTGAVDFFIPPNGAASTVSGSLRATLDFKGHSASGVLTGQIPGGPSCRMTMSASFA